MKKIPFFTLVRQNESLLQEIRKAADEVIKEGVFILGRKVIEFEADFAKYLGVKYAVGVANGTDALSLALMAVGIKAGDEVIMPANSYPTVFAVTQIGAVPKLADIDPENFNIDPDKIEKAITKRTKAVIAVHLYGQPADLGRIIPLVQKYKLKLIEDCAQSHGAEVVVQSHPGGVYHTPRVNFKWRKVGTVGDVGCFSFYPTKNLGCFGDGGMVVTNNEEIHRKVMLLRMYGEEKRYQSVLLGRNSRLDELQAAILLIKLKHLDKWNRRRREIASLYKNKIQISNDKSNSRLRRGFGGQAKFKIILPDEAKYARHVYHLYVIRSKKRDTLKKYLEENGILTAIHYPTPIHLVASMRYLGYKTGDFPESERACQEILSLPMFPELTNREIDYATKTIREASI